MTDQRKPIPAADVRQLELLLDLSVPITSLLAEIASRMTRVIVRGEPDSPRADAVWDACFTAIENEDGSYDLLETLGLVEIKG